ncbi:MAG: Gfo/Idh/MocA family oxidoreductase [Planctomycetaceae bacterium]
MTQPQTVGTSVEPTRISRRGFHRAAAAAASSAFSFYFIPSHAWGQLEKPALAGIGAGGKGASDISGAAAAGFQIAALVDVVDRRKLGGVKIPRNPAKAQDDYPSLPFFADYREMFDRMGDKIDAVTVSTPDHHHFHASLLAMRGGKHVYCQKPLTHGIWEARTLAKVAAETGVKTQMGNQAHAQDHMRRCIELIRAGVIGKIKTVHGWTNRPIWPQGMADPPAGEAVPDWMSWEQWIGPAPFADYSAKLAPFGWRGVWHYGSGALGDRACHILDIGWWALQPGAPLSVTAEEQGGTNWSPPISSKITWQFAPSKYTADDGCQIIWYDGYPQAKFDAQTWSLKKEGDDYNHPTAEVMGSEDYRQYDIVMEGERGRMFFNRDHLNWRLDVGHELDGFEWPEPTIPRAPEQDNYREWFQAVNGTIDRSQSDFSAAGPFTEMILLGTIAQRLPGKVLRWDNDAMTIKGHPEADAWIHRDYRPGWSVDV